MHLSTQPAAARAALFVVCLAVALGSAACSAEHYARTADRDALQAMRSRQSSVRRDRAETVQRPLDEVAPPEEELGPGIDAPLAIGLADCLRLATKSNRDYITQREGLYLQALSLLGTRQVFSTRMSAALSYAFADGDDFSRSHDVGFRAGASKILEFGGDLRLDLNSDFASLEDGSAHDQSVYDSNVSLSLSQPLLSGFGADIALEALTQAERDLLYATRDFELFRLDFAVNVATRYYDLVQRARSITNFRRNLGSVIFSRKQAEALFQVGRVRQLDVLRAKRSELNAQNDLIAAEENLSLALDRFKIFLGLDTARPLEIEFRDPDFVDVVFDLDSALQVALENRLDMRTRLDRLEDVQRSLNISADALRPALDLNLGAAFGTPTADHFDDQTVDRESYSLSLDFELPVDRVIERNAYRRAQIALGRARRDLDVFRDNLLVEIRGAFRELDRRKISLEIQRELITDQEKNLTIAQLRFARGDIPNRDVVEANQSLLEAENGLIAEQVNYELARLQLLRDLGILFVDENGIFVE